MSVERLYHDKAETYFANARHDLVKLLATDSSSAVLELGCGAGGTGAAVLAAGKAGTYTGIELNPKAAEAARGRLTEVMEGNVETMDLSALTARYDALIISEVLEHLTDPWRTLTTLAQCLRPGGQVFASSPNIAHFSVIRALALGRFAYNDVGVMDRTHLRWFTPQSYREMFEEAGIRVGSVEPVRRPSARARLINKLTRNRFEHLFMTQIKLSGVKA
jgi:2-polyprenyl-3-methyl-5-hydroxy-6-metoxy-1,4-benzoquinol methylase